MISKEDRYRVAAIRLHGSEVVTIDHDRDVGFEEEDERGVPGAWVPAWVFVPRESTEGGR